MRSSIRSSDEWLRPEMIYPESPRAQAGATIRVEEDTAKLRLLAEQSASRDCRRKVYLSCAVVVGLEIVVFTILMLTGFRTVDEGEQLLVFERDGRYTQNGPGRYYVLPGTRNQVRKAEVLSETEYSVVADEKSGQRRVQRGPGEYFLGAYEAVLVQRAAVTLTAGEYMIVNDTTTGGASTVEGPVLYFPKSAYEALGEKKTSTSLKTSEYMIIMNLHTGEKRVQRGPGRFSLEPFEEFLEVRAAVSLRADQYILVTNVTSGDTVTLRGPTLYFPDDAELILGDVKEVHSSSLKVSEYMIVVDVQAGTKRIQRGPGRFELAPSEELAEVRSSVSLKAGQYVSVTDVANGSTVTVRGPIQYVPSDPDELIGDVKDVEVSSLKAHEYMIVLDSQTGDKRVQKGPGRFTLDPVEELVEVRMGVSLKAHQYVFVTDMSTGTTVTVRGPLQYVPADPDAVVSEIKEVHILAEYETMVTRAMNGSLTYYSGANGGGNVVLEPDSEFLVFNWSAGGDMESNRKYDSFLKIDTRIRPLPFWFDDVRTSDNMEFELEGTIFWRVVDVQKLVNATSDPANDVWQRLRARIFAAATQYSYSDFLKGAGAMKDQVVADELSNQVDFYDVRGLELQSVELVEVELHSDELSKSVTDAVAAEATDRLNRIERIKTQNAIEMTRLEGEHQKSMQELDNKLAAETKERDVATQLVERDDVLKTLEEAKRHARDLVAEANAHALSMAQATNRQAVQSAALNNQVTLEADRSLLLDVLDTNARKEAESSGTSAGLKLAKNVDEYLMTLNDSIPELSDKIELYTVLKEMETRKATAANLAGGTAAEVQVQVPQHRRLQESSSAEETKTAAEEKKSASHGTCPAQSTQSTHNDLKNEVTVHCGGSAGASVKSKSTDPSSYAT
eukprot:TRINITY_DN9006_c0_g1_i3.p1 TRINITY_DN9006_c0_g1~~TRINITY_DN9006_c0_g1_i3.p1  ORF type:complete len:902 (+),score=160.60 TRINITY_DN9006_c0_g1_i3:188-2893(+)